MRVKKLLVWPFIVLFATITFAQQPSRLRDDDVKKLIEESEKTSDKFKDAFKKVSSLTTRDGVQVDVKKYMEDYEETLTRFKEGFDSDKTANSDLMNLFRMTNEIDALMTRNPDAAGAGSEWQAHKFNMDRLATAFRTNIGNDAPSPKRLSDDQTKALMEQLKESSKTVGKSIKDAMKHDPSIDKGTIEATEQSLKLLEKKAGVMKNLFDDKKPLNIEMQDFLRQMDSVKSVLTEHSLGAAVQSQWDGFERKANQLKEEYGFAS